MFDNETLGNGVTIRINRFESPNDGKLYSSLILRIKGNRTMEAHEIFSPTIKERKESARAKVEELENRMRPKMEEAKKSGIEIPEEEGKLFSREHNKWLSRYSNPLFDFDVNEEKEFVDIVTKKLVKVGFKKPCSHHTSNGEIAEEVLFFEEKKPFLSFFSR